jgi:hypothetical protein
MSASNRFNIAIRTYKRSDTIAQKTLKFLGNQHNIDLSEVLYLFVADEEEKKNYEAALGDFPRKDIVVGRKGIKEVTDSIFDYFGDGQNVFFFDDDLYGFFEYPGNPAEVKINKESTFLKEYLIDGFNTIEKENLSTFAFRSMQNPLFIKNKPFKEIRPHYLVGSAWGVKIKKELHSTLYGHNEDMERSAKVIEAEGGSLIYNWAGMITHIGNVGQGLNEGGMQSSGDRGSDDRLEFTKKVAFDLKEKTVMGKYFNGPTINEEMNIWDWKIKPISSLRKFNIREKQWPIFFDDIYVEKNNNALELE